MRRCLFILVAATACGCDGVSESPLASRSCEGTNIECERRAPTMWSTDELGARWDCTPELVELVRTWTWDSDGILFRGATHDLASNSVGQLLHFGGWYFPEPTYEFVREDVEGGGRSLFSVGDEAVHAMALDDEGCAYISTDGEIVKACEDGSGPIFSAGSDRTRLDISADGQLLLANAERAAKVSVADNTVLWRQTNATDAAVDAEWIDAKARSDGGLTLGLVGTDGDGNAMAQLSVLDGDGNVLAFGALPGVVRMDVANLHDGRVGVLLFTEGEDYLLALLGNDGEWAWSVAPQNDDGELLRPNPPSSFLYHGETLIAEGNESLVFYDSREGPNDGQSTAFAVEVSAAGDACRTGYAGDSRSDDMFRMPYGLTDAPGPGFFHGEGERSEFP